MIPRELPAFCCGALCVSFRLCVLVLATRQEARADRSDNARGTIH